jgi:hypothetical protein
VIGCSPVPDPSLEEVESLSYEDLPTDELVGDNEDCLPEPEPEIDLESHPFASAFVSGPDRDWEETIRRIKPRIPEFPPADTQRSRVRQLLDILDREPEQPSEEEVEEAKAWLTNIESIIPNHEKFVASGFSACYPAWHELLKDSNRKSARMIL